MYNNNLLWWAIYLKGAIFIEPLADNFNAVFLDTVSAVRAALRVKAALDAYNKDRDVDFQVSFIIQ